MNHLGTTRLLLVRHGESEWNAAGRWQGWGDPPLSEAGERQAQRAAVALRGLEAVVYASDLRRARRTAELLAEGLGLAAPAVEPGVREIDVGEWMGLTTEQIEVTYPGAVHAWRAGELDRPHGGETREHLLDRVLTALGSLAGRHPGATLLVVTHGGVIHTLERHLGIRESARIGNLDGRWFTMPLRPDGDRVVLAGHEGGNGEA